ncbi:unnamed protein product [Ceratitis capitata]|uniref:(Mediterranean fruit fly) hypothetical protein n=1 Tax=Ceratitis capitata TaxID=7213 RepID=A0A811V3W4_CERCA|nr:unnamed protein product [Ceratitis capitata]
MFFLKRHKSLVATRAKEHAERYHSLPLITFVRGISKLLIKPNATEVAQSIFYTFRLEKCAIFSFFFAIITITILLASTLQQFALCFFASRIFFEIALNRGFGWWNEVLSACNNYFFYYYFIAYHLIKVSISHCAHAPPPCSIKYLSCFSIFFYNFFTLRL